MSSYKPFTEILGEVMAKSAAKDDRIVPAREFVGGLTRMGDRWGITLEDKGILHLTKPALNQLVKDRLGGIPAFLNDPRVVEHTVQSYLMDMVLAGQSDKPLTLRITGNQIDGVLSEAYAFFDNQRLMLTLAGFMQAGFLPQQLLAHSYHVSEGARDLHMRLISPDNWNFKNGDEYYGSIVFSNNETGLGSLTVAPAIARVACFNWCVADNTVQAHHKWTSTEELDRTIEQGVKHIQEYSKVMFERIQHSHAVEFDHPETVFALVGKTLNLPNYVETQAHSYWIQEGQDRSLFGIVQAFTNGTRELTPVTGRKVPRWDDRNDIEHKIWMWSESILDNHQEGRDVNELFSSAELIQKSKVLEVLKRNDQWQPATELVQMIEPAGWVN